MGMTKLYTALAMLLLACSSQKNNMSTPPEFDSQGHRGARGLLPENTIPSMLKAIDLGVTTVELDVVISKDMQVVVSHDVYFHENITTTPEGAHLTKQEAQTRLLFEMDYDSIRKYDVGLKPHPDFPRQVKIAVHKPLLSELLQKTEAYAREKNRRIAYNIEIKSNPVNDGRKHPHVTRFADLVLDVVKAAGVMDRLTIQSFDMRAIQAVHHRYPHLTTALLVEGNDRRSLEEQLTALGYVPKVYSPHYSLVNPALVKACRERNMKLIPWTVNTLEQMKKLKDMGVNGIISDYPDLFAQL